MAYKILHILFELDGGGIDNLLYSYYRNISSNFTFDFVVFSEKEGILEDKIKRKGANIFHIPNVRKSFKGYYQSLDRIIREGQYDIVHCHQSYMSFLPLWIARKNNVKKRIAHVHGSYLDEKGLKVVLRHIYTFLTKKTATDLFSCGKLAGEAIYGNKLMKGSNIFIMPNAIDTDRFFFRNDIREGIRKKLNLEGRYVIGHVARFSHEKNHLFLIDVIKNAVEQNPNILLLLIGQGVMENEIKGKVNKYGISNNVIFLGIRKDVNELLNAMDLFVLPSITEGFPVTLVESQANGLKTLSSDVISKEVAITDLVEFLPLSKDIWKEKIVELSKDDYFATRENNLSDSIYNIKVATKIVEKKYLNILKEEHE